MLFFLWHYLDHIGTPDNGTVQGAARKGGFGSPGSQLQFVRFEEEK
jgi:hypothetical protein